MLNNEVKEIMYKKFDKDLNYQKIIKNVRQKEKNEIYMKIFQYALIPSCAVLILCAVFIVNNKNNNDSNIFIGKENVELQITIDENNTANEIIDINIKENTPQNKVDKTEPPKAETTPVVIAKKEIYKTINNSSEESWAFDPTIPENLLKDNKITKYLVKVKITSVGEGEMLPKQENLYNPYTCFTPIKMQVIENLNEKKLSGTITAYITGGKIKIENILKGTKQQIEYIGIGDVSKVDPEQYIEYIWSEPYFEPIVGEEYIMIIGKTNDNLYQVYCGGYGIFKVDKSKGQEKYINVITNKEWKLQ